MKKTILAGVLATLFVPATYANDIVEVPITNVQPNYSVSEVRVPVNNCNQQLVPILKHQNGFVCDSWNIINWLDKNYGDKKLEIKPQVDLYNLDGKEVIVLAEGSVLFEGSVDEAKKDEKVIESYLGRGSKLRDN